MLLYLLSALLQNGARQDPLPPPIAPPAPPAPAMYPDARRAMSQLPAPIDRFTVDVEISAGSELLWKGPLRLASNQPANFRREVTEAPAAPCELGPFGSGSDQSSITLTITPSRWVARENIVDVRLRWGRPSPDKCAAPGSSARSVELNESVELQPGKWVMVSGDAGLTLRVRRR